MTGPARRDPGQPLRDAVAALAPVGRAFNAAALKALRDLNAAMVAARLGRRRVGSLSVDIVVDATSFTAAMDRAREGVEEIQWRATIAHERALAREFLDDLVDEAWASYGWVRPTDGDPR